MEEIKLKIENLANKVFAREGMDLIELKVSGHPKDVFIQITADKPSGGITIGECAIMNKSLVSAIEQESFLPPESFSLELSSPGLDRPLVTRKDFLRMRGFDLHFWLKEPVEGKSQVQGVLVEVGEINLAINISSKKKLVLPLNIIDKGKLVI